jgi:hypothetical protein
VVRLACEQVNGIDFISPEEIVNQRLKPSPSPEDPLKWPIKANQNYKGLKSLVPDAAFGLHFTEGPNSGIAYFFVEADRSTEPLERRSNPNISTYYKKKMIGYYESWRQQLFQDNFGFKAARVLTITKSPERAVNMIQLNRTVDPRGNGFRMFLFAPKQIFSLERPERVLEEVWRNGRGERVSIIE